MAHHVTILNFILQVNKQRIPWFKTHLPIRRSFALLS